MLGGKLKTERLCFNKILKMKFKDLQLQKHEAKERSYWKESLKKILINRKKKLKLHVHFLKFF